MASTHRDARTELDTLRDLLRQDAYNPVLLRHCAHLALELSDYTEALEFATAAARITPTDPEARFHQSSALIGLGRYAEAVSLLSTLRGYAVAQPAVDTNLALCHYALGDYAAARPVLETLIAARSPSADVVRLTVSTLHYLGDTLKALAVADAHAELGTRDGAIAGVYALVYLDEGQAARAARYARNALAANPDSIEGLTVEATLKLAKLETASAEQQFRRALTLMPNNGRAWVGLGAIALLAQDLPRASECLERGVAVMPSHVGSWQVLGWTYLLEGNLDAAERMFAHALEMDRNFAEAHGSMASIHAMRGRAAEARNEIKVAERLDPKGLAARFAQAVLLGRAGDPEVGRALIRQTASSLAPLLGGRAAQLLADAGAAPTRH
jgi:Flp pilus assembly protein TadD